jgi:hypothetical protein
MKETDQNKKTSRLQTLEREFFFHDVSGVAKSFSIP